jgi:hypothetical protein
MLYLLSRAAVLFAVFFAFGRAAQAQGVTPGLYEPSSGLPHGEWEE